MSSKRSHAEISDHHSFASAAMSNKRPRASNTSKAAAASPETREIPSGSLSHGNGTNSSNFACYRAPHHSSGLEALYKPLGRVSERPHAVDGAYRAALSEKASETTQDELAEAHEEIRRLREELAGRDKMLRDKEAQAKQDLLLQTLLGNDQLAKVRTQLERERNHSMHITETHKTLVEDLESQLKTQRGNLMRTLNDVNMHKEDAEHYQNLNRIIEEDLIELRRIDAEDRQQRKIKSQGLPPAYGSLDDEDVIPPYGQHHDSGAVEFTTLKHVVRGHFRHAVSTLRTIASAPDPLLDRCERDTKYIVDLADALQSISLNIKNVADHATEVQLSSIKNVVSAPSAEELQREIIRHTHRHTAVASRCANLLIEITQRYISIMELRPLLLRFDPQQKALLFVAFTSLDNALLEILYSTFTSRDRLLEMQYYLTLVTSVQEQLRNNMRDAVPVVDGREGGPFFEASATWLSEQVEKERQLAAESPSVATDDMSIDHDATSDVLSSVPAAPLNTSTAQNNLEGASEHNPPVEPGSSIVLGHFDFEAFMKPVTTWVG